MKKAALVLFLAGGLSGQVHPLQSLIDAARAKSPSLKELLVKASPTLKTQGAAFVWGQDFLFAAESDKDAAVSIDGQPPAALVKIPESNVGYRLQKMRTGVTHSYQFVVDGKPFGTRRDLAGYNPDS
jgi:hypothetical protein